MYAAEAYHTRGAMRHVVGVLQLKVLTNTELTIMDYWVSMIENWADANKVYNHCKAENISLGPCLLSMTKYLFRTFNATKEIHYRLTSPVKTVFNILNQRTKKLKKGNSGVNFGSKNDLSVLTQNWIAKYKGQETEVPIDEIKRFSVILKCEHQNFTTCLNKINNLVKNYDHFLIKLSKSPTTEQFILLKGNGQVKTCQTNGYNNNTFQ